VKPEGTVWLVTGASRGIGRAVALAAAARGARVGLVARSTDDLEGVLAAIGGRGAVASADVTDGESIAAAVAGIEADLGPVDVLVNNAGSGSWGLLVDVSIEEAQRVMAVTYFGTLHATKAVLPGMLERRRGHIVNIGSIAGRIGAPFESVYSAAKFAVSGLSEALAVECAPFGVGVSLISPGPVTTDFFRTRGTGYQRSFPRPVPPERVARAVLAAVARSLPEQTIPRWLRGPQVLQALTRRGFFAGARRSFAAEVEADLLNRPRT
jgi:short-subunit dehydrogenase